MWFIKNNNLQVFKKKITWNKTLLKSLNLGRGVFRPKNKFRSFFGFLKPKPFIKESRYFFLKYLTINPRHRTFQKWVQNTKKIKSYYMPNISTNTPICLGVSELGLRALLHKLKPASLYRLKYKLFKHRVFKYTTPKRYTTTDKLGGSYLFQRDLRTGLVTAHLQQILPNASTISTYNWKSIN